MNMNESALEDLLVRLGRQRFVVREFNDDGNGPEAIGAYHHWGQVADVVLLIDERQACAYRTPLADAEGREIDVFDPETVYCWFTGSPAWTIRTLLELAQPAHPGAPRRLITAPGLFHFPESIRRSERVRMRPQR